MIYRQVYENGQIVLPKNLREILGLVPGAFISFRLENNKLVLEKKESVVDFCEKMAKSTKNFDAKNINKILDEEYEEEELKFNVR